MKIIFIGKVYFSYEMLLEIIDFSVKNSKISINVISSKKDSFNSDYKNLIPLCKKNRIEYHLTKDINGLKTLNWIRKRDPDLILCC